MSINDGGPGTWPADGLEQVGRCPACGSPDRKLLYEALEDRAFGCAPGSWSLHQCLACGSAYLDPRPTEASIGLAYEHYFTHGAGEPPPIFAAGFRRKVVNAYLNERYGTRYPEAARGGELIAAALPFRRAGVNAGIARHLPRACNRSMRLLDVGCGDGTFVEFAVAAGWAAIGIDPDPKAVALARSKGLDVRLADAHALPFPASSFDHVTASHVIEHVHHPLTLLRECRRVLAPGGRLWLETPNIGSIGHAVFKRAWRGLEPPRHLLIFSRMALCGLLRKAGFEVASFHFNGDVTRFIWASSRLLAASEERSQPATMFSSLGASPPGRILAECYEAMFPNSREFLTCTAVRGNGSQ